MLSIKKTKKHRAKHAEANTCISLWLSFGEQPDLAFSLPEATRFRCLSAHPQLRPGHGCDSSGVGALHHCHTLPFPSTETLNNIFLLFCLSSLTYLTTLVNLISKHSGIEGKKYFSQATNKEQSFRELKWLNGTFW